MQTNRELIVEPIGLDVDNLPRPLKWRELYGNDHPVEIEIGMGKGTFLTEQEYADRQKQVERVRVYQKVVGAIVLHGPLEDASGAL